MDTDTCAGKIGDKIELREELNERSQSSNSSHKLVCDRVSLRLALGRLTHPYSWVPWLHLCSRGDESHLPTVPRWCHLSSTPESSFSLRIRLFKGPELRLTLLPLAATLSMTYGTYKRRQKHMSLDKLRKQQKHFIFNSATHESSPAFSLLFSTFYPTCFPRG